jgi:hypothetical protein
MKVFAFSLIPLLSLGAVGQLFAQTGSGTLSNPPLEQGTARWFQQKFDRGGRYMWREPDKRENVGTELPRRVDSDGKRFVVEGWSNFPTELWEYAAVDSTKEHLKLARVVLLNPSATQVAQWVVTTCERLKQENPQVYPEPTQTYIELLVGSIWEASNAQFPVAGIVYEDLVPRAGVDEIYCFRDGVTVGLRAFTDDEERRTKYIDPPTSEQIEAALQPDDEKITWVGKFARIQSTSRQQYHEGGDLGQTYRRAQPT